MQSVQQSVRCTKSRIHAVRVRQAQGSRGRSASATLPRYQTNCKAARMSCRRSSLSQLRHMRPHVLRSTYVNGKNYNAWLIFHMIRANTLIELRPGETVLVAGATGGVGQIAVSKLIDAGFNVRALTRSAEKARSILHSNNIEIMELDPRDSAAVDASDVYKGCAGAIVAIGTTAFPSKRWDGDNGPEQTDLVSTGNLIRAAPASLKHFALCTSAGVERSGSFPFVILNLFGVLKYKKMAEETLKASGLSHTIVRPSRLTDGPYTSYDLNTLLKATSGKRHKVVVSRKDDLVGEASRIATAEMLVQSLVTPQLQGETLALSTVEGPGPGSDSDAWAKLVESL